MTCLFLAEKWCRIRDSVSALNCQLASLAAQNRQKKTCCVVLKVTEEEKKDAADCGVELILPFLSEELKVAVGNNKPKMEWLLSPETYFPTLVELQNVDYIIEHVQDSTTFLYANSLTKRYFHGADIVIVNHSEPPKDNELKATQLKFAESASAVFSIGPKIFEEYGRLYKRTDIKVKHELYLPRPEMAFFDLNVDRSGKMNALKQILSVISDKDVECKKHEIVSAAVGQSAETFNTMCVKIPKWCVRTKSETDPDDTRVFLTKDLKCSCIEPITYPPYGSQDEPYSDLLESDVLIIPPGEPFSMEALQAIAAGLPVLVPKRTATAEFLQQYFPNNAEYFLYDPVVGDLSKQINKMLNSTETTGLAIQLKNKYLSHQTVTETCENFRSCLLGTRAQQASPDVYPSVTIQKFSVSSPQNNSTDDGVGSFEDSQSNQSQSSHSALLSTENRARNKKSTAKKVFQRKRPHMPTIRCDSHLEVEGKKIKAKGPQLRDKREIKRLVNQKKVWALKYIFKKKVEKIEKRNDPDVEEQLDKAYDKFEARLDKILEGCLRCLLSFLSVDNIDNFWLKYEAGDLDETLGGILITTEMRSLAEEAGCTVRIRSTIDKMEYGIVRKILQDMSAVYTIPDRTWERTIAHDRWERYILQHVDEHQARYLIEQSRYNPVVSEFRSDEFFFPAFVSFWYENCYTLPSTLTEATEYAIRYHVKMYCKEHQLQIENLWHVVQCRLSEIGEQVFDAFMETKTFSQELDVPNNEAYLFGLLKDEDQPSPMWLKSKRVFVPQQVYFYCLAVYLSKTKNAFFTKNTFEPCIKELPSVLYYVAGILKEKSMSFFMALRNCLMKTYPRTFEQLSLLGRALLESNCPGKFQAIAVQLITSFRALDLSVTDLNNISPQAVEAVSFIFSNICHLKNITLVSLKQQKDLSQQFKEGFESLLKHQTSFVHVKVKNKVELEVISQYIVFHQLFISQGDCQHHITSIKLEAVSCNFNRVDRKVMKVFVNALASLPRLKSLLLAGFEENFVTDMFDIMIEDNVILKVRSLGLSQNNLEYTFTKIMLKAVRYLPLLKQLDVGSNSLCGLGCIRLLPLCSEVDVILENNKVEDGLKTLSESEKLVWGSEEFMQEATQINSLQDIENLQKTMSSVTDADLSNVSPKIVNALCHTLAFFSNLNRLNLNNCNITREVAVILADSLEHLLSLNHLDISSNNIGDEGIIHIGSKMHVLKHLRYANFHNTQISVRGMVHLLDIVQEQQQKYINVSDNMKGFSHILPYIKVQLPRYHHDLVLNAEELLLITLTFLHDIIYMTTCDFEDMQLTHTEFENFCQGLSHLYSLRQILLGKNNISDISVKFLCSALATLAKVKHFDYSHINTDVSAECLSKRKMNIIHQVVHIDLSHNNIGDVGAESLSKGMENMSELQHLDLSHNNIGDVGAESLSVRMENMTELWLLDLSHNNIGDVGAKSFCKGMQNMTELQHLDLSHNKIGEFGAQCLNDMMVYRHESIDIDISHNDIKDVGVEFLSRKIKHLKMAKTHLDLSHKCLGNFAAVTLSKLMRNMTELQHLDLSHNNIGDVGAESLSKGMENMTRLRHLDLSHNNIGDVGAESLSNGMENMTELRHLDLSHNNIGDVGAESLSKGMENMTWLEHLDLSHNNICDVGAESLSKGMENMTRLQHLDLSHNNIGDVGAESLSKGIENMTGLWHLDLSHNNIGDVGAESLSKGIENMTWLRHLDLSHNNIGDVGAESLSKGMENMTRLRHLDLSHNNIGDVGAEILSNREENIGLRKSVTLFIDLHHNKLNLMAEQLEIMPHFDYESESLEMFEMNDYHRIPRRLHLTSSRASSTSTSDDSIDSFQISGHSSNRHLSIGHDIETYPGSDQGIETYPGSGHDSYSYLPVGSGQGIDVHQGTGEGIDSYPYSRHDSYSSAGSGHSSGSSAGGE